MQIDLISIGKLKEKYWQDAEKEYLKRLSKYIKINIINIKDESNNLSKEEVLKKESQKIIPKLSDRSYIIILDINGEQLDSINFSKTIEKVSINYSKITFIIGGSYGLHVSVQERANLLLSFSVLTFPHQLFKIIFLEQLYRSYKILEGGKYHK